MSFFFSGGQSLGDGFGDESEDGFARQLSCRENQTQTGGIVGPVAEKIKFAGLAETAEPEL